MAARYKEDGIGLGEEKTLSAMTEESEPSGEFYLTYLQIQHFDT